MTTPSVPSIRHSSQYFKNASYYTLKKGQQSQDEKNEKESEKTINLFINRLILKLQLVKDRARYRRSSL